MTIFGACDKLAFCRLGEDTHWNYVQSPAACDDVIYYKEKFYAVDCHGVVFICDIDDDQAPKVTPIAQLPMWVRDFNKKYLVESSGNLFLLYRIFHIKRYTGSEGEEGEEGHVEGGGEEEEEGHVEGGGEEEEEEEEGHVGGGGEEGHYIGGIFINDWDELGSEEESDENEEESDVDSFDEEQMTQFSEAYKTIGFIVFKMEERKKMGKGCKYNFKFVEVDNVGDQVFFIGENASLSLTASNVNGCKPNSIYFTEDRSDLYHKTSGGHDMGVFNIDDESFSCHYKGQSISFFSPPLWYI